MNLQKAVTFLSKQGKIESISSIYETSPLEMDSENDFYNLALEADLPLDPFGLLRLIKKTENTMGRKLINSYKNDRIIDIDILFANDCIITSGQLSIPHPEIENRAFVLVPMDEIAPEMIHPVIKSSIKELLANLPDERKCLDCIRKVKMFHL